MEFFLFNFYCRYEKKEDKKSEETLTVIVTAISHCKHKSLHKLMGCSCVLGIKGDKTGKMSFLSAMAVTLPERALLVKLFYENKGNAAAALREFRRL